MNRRVYILYMMCLLTATGCSTSVTHEEEVIRPTEERVPVSFGYYTGSAVATRANAAYFIDGEEKKTIPEGTQVGVFGYYQGQTAWADGTGWTADFMYNQPMTASAATTGGVTTAQLTYSPAAYWPNTPGDMLTFVAYYPYTNSESDTGITPQIERGNGTGSFRFSVKAAPEQQVDFLVSDIAADQKKQTVNGRVTLTFHHALAQVSAQVRLTKDMLAAHAEAEIKSLKLEGIMDQGTCTPTYGNNGSTSLVWSSQGFSTGNRTGTFDTTGKEGNAAILLMIPQPLTDSKYLTVSYDINFYDKDGEGRQLLYSYTDNETRVSLGPAEQQTEGSAAVTRWEAGKKYVYNVMVDLKEIVVLPTVSPWIVAGEDLNINNGQ